MVLYNESLCLNDCFYITCPVYNEYPVNSNFPVYNECSIYIGSTNYSFVLLTKTLLYFMTVLSIDETHDHHDLYFSIGISVTMIVLLITTVLFILAFL